jgi:protoheme IX farnesyltransferase
MKATVSSVSAAPAVERGAVGVFLELIKARLTLLVLITTAVGFYVGSEGVPHWLLFLNTLLGTGAVAAAAAMLNQWMERDADALMARTQDRPLPAGRVRPETVLLFGVAGASGGLGYLWWMVNGMTALLGAATLLTYVMVYTPLKRVTHWNTWVGAIPGALPPVMGWTAVRGEVGIEAWSLFGLLAVWQIPHFLAIAWMYRGDYERGGFKMLPGVDEGGVRTAFQSVACCVGLLAVSVAPYWLGMVNMFYAAGALVAGLLFLWRAVEFRAAKDPLSARRLFLVSILYLPLVLGLMVITKN